MKLLYFKRSILLWVFTIVFLTSCAHTRSIPTQTMEFEPGMQVMAANLADQLERSSLGNQINKIVINPLTKQKELKKIVIDPFIDTESGYPVKVNSRIHVIFSTEIAKRFSVTGEMMPENLEVSEYVLTGMVTLEEKIEGRNYKYKVYSAVFEKSSGVVHASASVHIRNFDTTPMDIYKDSPTFLKGQNYNQHVDSVKKKPNESVNKTYHDKLPAKSIRVKGDALYEKKEYAESLNYYNQAERSMNQPEMEVLNGLFTNLVRQESLEEAERIYGKLLRLSIAETNGISSKITFSPNATMPIANKARIYMIYMRQIAKFVVSKPSCRVTIIGHCSRTGSEAYNDTLSLQRAQSIQKQMSFFAPEIIKRTEAIGRGFRENIVGTGRDDLTDEIDRRVEFKFNKCGE
jgi:outer membrane protein OmpA-like peptidoglycan-associated protein